MNKHGSLYSEVYTVNRCGDMGRFLLYISYIGQAFSGLQRQRAPGVQTIIGALEDALNTLPLSHDALTVTSSRTDRGVNALFNTIHVDLTHRDPDEEISPDIVTARVNEELYHKQCAVRVLQTLRVSDEFHARFQALSRTYIYRNAICRTDGQAWCLPCTPFNYMRQYLQHQKSCNLDLLHQVAGVLSGTHDFSAFTKPRMMKERPWSIPVKTLTVQVQEGRPFMSEHLPDIYHQHVHHVDFIFKSSSFLYRQVRKMSAVMIAVGNGTITLDTVREMLEEPEKEHIQCTSIYNIPAFALYLKEVEYKPEDLLYRPKDDREETATSPLEGVTVHPPDGAMIDNGRGSVTPENLPDSGG